MSTPTPPRDNSTPAKPEVLSFDHNGKPVAFACKP